MSEGASLPELGKERNNSRQARHSWRRSLRGYLLLPHLIPVLVVLLATVGFAGIAWEGAPPPYLLGRLLLAMLGAQIVIGVTNEIVDLPVDRRGQPGKPLPSGDVSLLGAKIMAGTGLLLMLAFGLPFGLLSFALLTLGMALGLAYDLWLKRSPWSWAPYVLALPLLPIWVFVALGRTESKLLFLYPLGALAAAGAHLAQALPDVASDRAAGLPTVTARLGTRRAFFAAWALAGSAPVLAWVAASRFDFMMRGGAALAASFTAILLLCNVALFVAYPRLGARACFPLVAAAIVATALAWIASVSR